MLLLAVLIVSTLPFSSPAEPLQGHVKLQHLVTTSSDESLNSLLDQQTTQLASLDLRLLGRHYYGAWELAADYEAIARSGSAIEFSNDLRNLFPLFASTREQSQWLDLEHTISDSSDSELEHRLDRIYLGYSSSSLVVKLGRQALTWSNGFAFHPMDLFNPFSPDAVDTSYKPGTDMLYTQWLFDNGSDLSGLVVPRRDPLTDDLEQDLSSAAIKWHFFGETLQGDFMLAADYDDTVAGIGINGPLGEAAWRMDVVPVFLDKGGSKTSLVINIDTAWIWLERNLSGHIEYFRNGFGLSQDQYSLQDLPPELVLRLGRGQLFNTGRDYLSGGLRLELTPLLQLNPLLIMNLNDNSALLFIQGYYSLQQDITLDFGLSIGFGASGTEYGGLETVAGSGVYVENSDQAFVRLALYF